MFAGIIGSGNNGDNDEKNDRYRPLEMDGLTQMMQRVVNDEDKINTVFQKGNKIIEKAKKTDEYMSKLPDSILNVIYLWTTNVLYKQLNAALESNKLTRLNEWK